MVWTPEQTGQFLDSVKGDRLYSLWHTFVFSGPRRGEMCALPWPEVSLDALWLSLNHGEVLSRWQDQETKELNEWAGVEARVESDRVWTHENGEPLHPDWVSRRFKRLVELSGLPPVRLHDLRHISATPALLGKADIKVVQERLGHSSRQITSHTYTSVLPEMMRTEAESTLSVVPREVAYDVHQQREISPNAFRGNVAVLFAHGARYTGSTWVVGAQTGPRAPSSERFTPSAGAKSTRPTPLSNGSGTTAPVRLWRYFGSRT
ncbi:tyrosine-type recombinase/integrase [Streptomyces sp. OK228]|uniref:tyrosine-type recombinase/integrase n=1 Tax=Streptomyces sp. OK228 TaxID=1882786 RepID=UPI000BE2D303|nr:tyrosine-type recombinase/integrase [Streptomyces sp. OK228]